MDILIHPFPSNEQEFYQRLAPLLNALITDSTQESVNSASQLNSCTAKPSSHLQESTQPSSSKPQESAPLTVQETASHERTLANKIDVKGKAPLHDQALNNSQGTLKKRTIIRKNQIKVRLPNGSVLFSPFEKDDVLSRVVDWVLAETRFSRVKLSRSVPLQTFDDSDYSKSLEELKIFGNTLVAETEEDTPGFLNRIISLLLLFLKGIYDAFLGLFGDSPPQETKASRSPKYNGNSTNLE